MTPRLTLLLRLTLYLCVTASLSCFVWTFCSPYVAAYQLEHRTSRLNHDLGMSAIEGEVHWTGEFATSKYGSWRARVQHLDDERAKRLARTLSKIKPVRLEVESSSITDCGVEELAKIEGIESLVIAQCPKVTVDGLAHVSGIKSLQVLALFSVKLSDEAVSHLKKMSFLDELHLRDTGISANGLRELRLALSKTVIFSS